MMVPHGHSCTRLLLHHRIIYRGSRWAIAVLHGSRIRCTATIFRWPTMRRHTFVELLLMFHLLLRCNNIVHPLSWILSIKLIDFQRMFLKSEKKLEFILCVHAFRYDIPLGISSFVVEHSDTL